MRLRFRLIAVAIGVALVALAFVARSTAPTAVAEPVPRVWQPSGIPSLAAFAGDWTAELNTWRDAQAAAAVTYIGALADYVHQVEVAQAEDARRATIANRESRVATPAPQTSSSPEPAAPVEAPSGSAEEAIARWFPDNYAKAVRVATCESGMRPGAISPGGGNYGLFQINTVHAKRFAAITGLPYYNGALNADANAHYARVLFDEQGWGPWSCGRA